MASIVCLYAPTNQDGGETMATSPHPQQMEKPLHHPPPSQETPPLRPWLVSQASTTHTEYRRQGTNPPLGNWEGWGEGPRGKGRGKFPRPPDTTNARTEHRVGRGQRYTGPNLVTSPAVTSPGGGRWCPARRRNGGGGGADGVVLRFL